MFEVVALIFQGIEYFILDFPSTTTASHHLIDIATAQFYRSDPRAGFGFAFLGIFFIIQKIDPKVSIAV